MYCVASAVQWAGTWQWSARPYRFSCHPAPEALPLDRVNRKGEGKPLALAMGQVTNGQSALRSPSACSIRRR